MPAVTLTEKGDSLRSAWSMVGTINPEFRTFFDLTNAMKLQEVFLYIRCGSLNLKLLFGEVITISFLFSYCFTDSNEIFCGIPGSSAGSARSISTNLDPIGFRKDAKEQISDVKFR